MNNTPRRVLLLTDRYPPHAGGVARSSQRLTEYSVASGIKVHVLVTRSEGAPGALNSAREGDVWVHRLGASQNAADNGQFAAAALSWLHERENFDLLHGHYAGTAGFLAAYHARLLGIASYVSLRGNDLDRDAYDPARFAHLQWTLQNAGTIGAVSRALTASAAALSGRDDIRYTPNSVDAETFCPAAPNEELRARLGLDGGPIIGFAGELRPKKGAVFLLEAFRTVAISHSHNAQLLIVGEIRPDERRLIETFSSEEPQLAARIAVYPYTHDKAELAALYNLMDVAICPSLWEGMPNFVLEAMACARPILASDAGGLPDLISHGETGWMLSRHQLPHLGEALDELLSLDEAERAQIGHNARDRVLRDFTPQRESGELMAGYEVALECAKNKGFAY